MLWFAIALAAVVRLVTLGAFPLLDTTEARYAEIGRRMIALGDWITPWIGPGEPFWGKPPFSFWMTAASFKVLGVGEFAARLPHWLGGCLVAWIVWNWLARRSRREAAYAVALMAGSALFFASAGAVMTDIALALGLTLAMRGFWLALHGEPQERLREQLLLFVGLGIGLLAKGPIAAMAGIPYAVWAIRSGQTGRVWRKIAWLRGLLPTLVIALPWYALAEMRSPGFLNYFLVGEHWQRFTESGWSGDLYGSSHDFPRGTIWLFAWLAFLPWTFLVPIAVWKWRRMAVPPSPQDRALHEYLWLWALTPCVVFTLAGNILWTYALPGVPALAMLGALRLNRMPDPGQPARMLAAGVAFTAMAAAGLVAGFNAGGWSDARSTRALVGDYESLRGHGEELVFLGKLPASGSFYTRGRAELIRDPTELESRLARGSVYVVVRDRHLGRLPESMRGRLDRVASRGDYQLFLGERESHPSDGTCVQAENLPERQSAPTATAGCANGWRDSSQAQSASHWWSSG